MKQIACTIIKNVLSIKIDCTTGKEWILLLSLLQGDVMIAEF